MQEFCPGEMIQVKLPDEACQDVFLCHKGKRPYVRFDNLCDEIESCGDGRENELCRIARETSPSLMFFTLTLPVQSQYVNYVMKLLVIAK